jgi:N-acetylgalactosamine kinase
MGSEFCSITLAAGVGSRMPKDAPPKACCRIGPVSVIENALEAYEQAGIERHVVVVGSRAAEVMEEVCRRRRNVLFAYQPRPRGTGDAVHCALELLEDTFRPEHLLISAGDKVVAPALVKGVVESYTSSAHDLCVLAGSLQHNPEGGRIVVRDGQVLAIIESPDIRARQVAEKLRSLSADDRPGTVAELKEFTSQYLPEKRLVALAPALATVFQLSAGEPVPWPKVLSALEAIPEGFALRSGRVSLAEAAASTLINLSLYVGRFGPLREAVRQLASANAQAECYLTDVVEILSSSGRSVGLLKVQDPEDVLAFNTNEQLEEVRRVYARRLQNRLRFPKVEGWLAHFARREPDGLAVQAVRGLAERIGRERTCIVVRSPGRINIMGRHIDHQGGTCNLMAINREVVMAASPRDDDQIQLWNADPEHYPSSSFTFGQLTADIVWDDWLRTLDLQYVKRLSSMSIGNWANYVIGAALRLQHHFRDRQLTGMDAFVCGNIPVGSGLSSSSALVVAATEALVELNALNVHPKALVDLCGEGEWFVGTRGGSADHAAITLGREKEVVSVSFFPFEVVGRHPFPDDFSLLVCHSGSSAKKTENAQARFNARIACYHMAREMLRQQFPAFAPLIRHLRDVSQHSLDISLPALYRLLKRLPLEAEPGLVEDLAARHPTVANCVTGLDLGRLRFPLRDTALFGLGEMERAKRAGTLLDRGDVGAFGEMMNVSHTGDRVTSWQPDCVPFSSPATDACLDSLVERAEALRPLTSSDAALWQQPGAYSCSTPEIDFLVDQARRCPGVLGAQLSGAGLGGCVMILVRTDSAPKLQEVLEGTYYIPRNIEPQLFVCQPSRGSQVLTSIETAS